MRLEFMALTLMGAGLGAAPAWGQTYATFGDGTLSCGTWTANRLAGGVTSIGVEQWVLGDVSASNEALMLSSGKSVDINTDANGIYGWIDNYCKANPTINITNAADAFLANSGAVVKSSN